MHKNGFADLFSSKKYLNFTFVQVIMHHPLIETKRTMDILDLLDH